MKRVWIVLAGLLMFFGMCICVFGQQQCQPFNFYGYAKLENGSEVSGANITITIYNMSAGHTKVTELSDLTDSDGFFNISVSPATDDLTFKVSIYKEGGTVHLVGPSVPDVFCREFMELNGINFTLVEAAKVNITVINGSGDNVKFYYEIKDTKLGYPIAEYFNNSPAETGGITEAIVFLPAHRNYSIQVFPAGVPPTNYDLNNISDYPSPKNIAVKINGTPCFAWVSGYAKNSSGFKNWDNLTVVAYPLEPGNMIFFDHPFELNMSAWRNESDFYNASDGFYNITLPGTAQGTKILLIAVAQKGDQIYLDFKNITIDSGAPRELNFTVMPALGTIANWQLETAGEGDQKVNISNKFVLFEFVNETDALMNKSKMHVEIEFKYSDITFSIMEDTRTGTVRLPVAEGANMSVFAFAPESAPRKKKFDNAQNDSYTIKVYQFGIKDPKGDKIKGVKIKFYRVNESLCDRPYPDAGCSLKPEKDALKFNPFKLVFGGGRMSMRVEDQQHGIVVHYVDVDLLASGPPDIIFDDQPNETTSDTGLDAVWRFGSMGPDVYKHVLIGVRLDPSVDFSAPIKFKLDKLYGENWNVIYNGSGDLPDDYSDFNSSMFNLNTCNTTDQMSIITGNAFCYVNISDGMLWFKIPHFSGVGSLVSSITKGNVTAEAESDAIECMPNCSFEVNVTNKNWTIAQSLHNITINTIKDSGLGTLKYVKIYWWNESGSEWTLLGENNTIQINYNLTFYNSSDSSTIHRYKFEVNKTNNRGVVLNLTYSIFSPIVSLPLQIELQCVENWKCDDWSDCEDGVQTRKCWDLNDCGTENNKPETERSCTVSSSRRGGGGGSAPVTEYGIGEGEASKYVGLKRGGKVKFKIKGKEHTAKVDKVFSDHVVLIIESDPISVELYVNETKMVDVDADGTDDLEITLHKIEGAKAYMTFTLLGVEAAEEVEEEVTEEKPPEKAEEEEEVVEVVTPEEKKEIKEKAINKAVIGIVIGIIALIFVLILFVLGKKRKQ